jgi:hypothetical protein
MTKLCKLSLNTAVFLMIATSASQSLAATYKMCARWGYVFDDQNLGEDYLKYTGSYGQRTASYTWGELEKDGQTLWSGYMDSSGCTGGVPTNPGTYTLWVTSAIRATTGAVIWIFPTEAEEWKWYASTQTISGSGDRTIYATMGIDPTSSVAAIAAEMAAQQDGRFVAGNTYTVYSELFQYIGAYSGGIVKLGYDEYTDNWIGYLKTVVAHELGHAIQDKAVGTWFSTYSENSDIELCQCDHLDYPALQLHCLQSRENIGAAQGEGFGSFIAADLFNRGSDSDAVFAYYKEVRWDNGGPDQYPPVPVSVYNSSSRWHWMEAKGCGKANSGVELDWMDFFYQINNKTSSGYSYSIVDIMRAFYDACGGRKCNGNDRVYWSTLQSAVNARFGSSSAKAQYWAQAGNWNGVNW